MSGSTLLEKICDGADLSGEEIGGLFTAMVDGEMSETRIAALLAALKAKGETPSEIAGAARALRASAQPFPRPDGEVLVDSCGTGGDGSHTINVSTAVALVAAELGLKVVKHGNRSVSSACGSADVLERLGVTIDVPPEIARACLDEAGICFLFAPAYHPGLRHAMPVRRELGVRTIFNLLGPLVNPAAPSHQVMGVYDPSLCAPLAETLWQLGATAALVVHGSGLDEIALHGPTRAALLREGRVEELEITPEAADLERHPLEAIRGGGPEENAEALESVLSGGGPEAHQSAVAINAGALAWITGLAADLPRGVELAIGALRSGRCRERLVQLARLSHGA